MLLLDHIDERGCELFAATCERDLEGIVAKWRYGRYTSDGSSTSWLKIKNPEYWQMEGGTSCRGQRPSARVEHLSRLRGRR